MTIQEAIFEIAICSYGTLATLTGLGTYDAIDKYLEDLNEQSRDWPKGLFDSCESWQDAWSILRDYLEESEAIR